MSLSRILIYAITEVNQLINDRNHLPEHRKVMNEASKIQFTAVNSFSLPLPSAKKARMF